MLEEKTKVLSSCSHAFLIAVTGIFLASCGGSSGGDNANNDGAGNNQPVQVSQQAFTQTYGEQDAVYRVDVDVNISSSIQIELLPPLSGVLTINTEAEINALQSIAVDFNATNDISNDLCDLRGFVSTSDNLELESIEPIANPAAAQNCVSNYFEVSPTQGRIDISCGDEFSSEVVFTRLANDAGFNLGSLSLDATTTADLNSTSGVCGNMASIDADTEQTSTDPSFVPITPDEASGSTSIVLVSPYVNENRIRVSLRLPSADISPGVFEISEPLDFPFNGFIRVPVSSDFDTIAGEPFTGPAPISFNPVSLTFESAEFGGIPEAPGSIRAEAGTITVTDVTEFGVTGSFDVVTEFGETITGNFSLDLSE